MIYDLIENIKAYRGLSRHLDTAIDFIMKNDLNTLPLGRTEIDGAFVFANVMEASAKAEEEINFEVHQKYMDIQIDLEGCESIATGLGDLEEVIPYDEGKDIGFYKGEKSAYCEMGPGRFIICMVNEPHKPGIKSSDKTELRKCVIKVAKEA